MARWFALAIATGALIVSGRNLAAIGTVCLPNRYPVARQPTTQINLKVPTTVAADWRRRAAAAGHDTIRSWLLAVVGTEDHLDDGLTLQSLDRRLCALEAAAAVPARPVSAPRAAVASEALVEASDGPLLTADLARLLGRSLKALTARASAGGIGTVVDGWVVTGQVKPPSGGPMRWIWEPVAEGQPLRQLLSRLRYPVAADALLLQLVQVVADGQPGRRNCLCSRYSTSCTMRVIGCAAAVAVLVQWWPGRGWTRQLDTEPRRRWVLCDRSDARIHAAINRQALPLG